MLDKLALTKGMIPLVTGLFILQGQTIPVNMPEVAIVESITKLGAFGLSMFFNFAFWRKIEQVEAKKDEKDRLIVELTKSVTEAIVGSKLAVETNVRVMSQMSELLIKIERNVDRIDNVRAILDGSHA